MKGIDNWFAIENIFGDNITFSNATIKNAKYDLLSGTITIDIILDCEVKNPPAKWGKWDKVYIKVDFFCVSEAQFTLKKTLFKIVDFTICEESEYMYRLNMQSEVNDKLNFLFGLGRIQNIKPLVYNSKYDRYEVNPFQFNGQTKP